MKKSILTLLLLGSAAAFAGDAAEDQANRTPFASQTSRAEVKAALAQARSAGQVGIHTEHAAHFEAASQGRSRSRSEVRAEAVQAARTPILDHVML